MAKRKIMPEPPVPHIVHKLGLVRENYGVWARPRGELALFWDDTKWYVYLSSGGLTVYVEPENLETMLVAWVLEGKFQP